VCADQGGDGIAFFFYANTFTPGPGRIAIPTEGYSIKLDTYTGRSCDVLPGELIDYVSLKTNRDYDSDILAAVAEPRVEDNAWHQVRVLYDNGRVAVSLDGDTLLDYTITNPSTSASAIGFHAMTGRATNNQIIDDFTLTPLDASTPTVSGTIRDSQGASLPGVHVSAGDQPGAITDANGTYTVTVVTAGAVTLGPQKAHYDFSPSARTVTMPSSVTGADFTGTAQPWFGLHNVSTSCATRTDLTTTNFATGQAENIFTIEGIADEHLAMSVRTQERPRRADPSRNPRDFVGGR
jgi:hypothetical protein